MRVRRVACHAKQIPRRGCTTLSVYPEVRAYADPFEGLTVQLGELRGLIKIVPRLIDADRERGWKEICTAARDLP